MRSASTCGGVGAGGEVGSGASTCGGVSAGGEVGSGVALSRPCGELDCEGCGCGGDFDLRIRFCCIRSAIGTFGDTVGVGWDSPVTVAEAGGAAGDNDDRGEGLPVRIAAAAAATAQSSSVENKESAFSSGTALPVSRHLTVNASGGSEADGASAMTVRTK